jgi:hypothetical protein
MSLESLKRQAKGLALNPRGNHEILRRLIVGGFLDSPVSSAEVVHRIRERFGPKWKTNHVQTYMTKFMRADIIHAVKPAGSKQNYWVLLSVSREQALRALARKGKTQEVADDLFSPELMRKLNKDFSQDIEELRCNFGKNGNCAAFLLRKILEKLIILAFSKNQREELIEDKGRPGGWTGLKNMIETAAREKLHGIPFLTSKTALEIKGLKFLGDTAAHNPLVNVSMQSIKPQMPYMITAYEELAKRL